MTQQFITCPIKQTDDNHYSKIRELWPTWEWSWFSDSPLTEHFSVKKDKQPSTYYRVFKRRHDEKGKKKQLYGPMYIVMSVNKQPVAIVETKKEALHILNQDRPKRKIFRRPHKDSQTGEHFGDLEVGSFILKIPRAYKFDVSQRDHTDDVKHMVATKKCAECPNKTSTRGACHCGFWSVIRDSTMGGQWWSMHDIKRYQKREKKRKVINIVIGPKDLLD